MTTSQVLKIKREKLAACMTCPLCEELFKDATTVTECLHTFCRKCIHDKIMEDDLESCPVCDIKLGCPPLEKLRADHNLQDLMFKIFPSRRHSSGAPEAVSSVLRPLRRKQRSLSSFAIGKPKLSVKSRRTGRRSKLGSRKKPVVQESTFPVKETIKDEEAHQASLISPQTFSGTAEDKRLVKIPFAAETSKQQTSDEDEVVEIVLVDKKAGLWKPVNSLGEAASKTRSNKSNSCGTLAKPAVPDAHDNETRPKTRVKRGVNASKVHGEDSHGNERRPKTRVKKGGNASKVHGEDAHDNETRREAKVKQTSVPFFFSSPPSMEIKARVKKGCNASKVHGEDAHDSETRREAKVKQTSVPFFFSSPPSTEVKARVKKGGNASKVHGEDAHDNETCRKARVQQVSVPFFASSPPSTEKGGNSSKVHVEDAHDKETRPKARVKEGRNASKVHGEENNARPAASGSVRPRRYQSRQKRGAVFEGSSVQAQAIVDANSKRNERSSPIWFSLVASDDLKGAAPLQQITTSYLKIIDGSLPVSSIQKYLVRKLSLASEDEVEISMLGQPLFSALRLHNIVNWYLQTAASSEKIQTTVGSSAKDFTMVLTYGRKAPPRPRYFKKNAYSHYFQ